MTIELSKYVIDAIADAVVKKMQEPILNKIRAEVMSLTDGCTPELIRNVDVLEIIDKYRTESEEE